MPFKSKRRGTLSDAAPPGKASVSPLASLAGTVVEAARLARILPRESGGRNVRGASGTAKALGGSGGRVEDGGGNNPWWLAGALGAVSVVLAVLRAWDFFRSRRDEGRGRQIQLDATQNREVASQQKEARRDAATEAWEVVDRLNDEVERLTSKVREIEERERECAEGRAAERAVLLVMIAWAKRQKNPPPIPEDILARLKQDGSGPHHTLPGGGVGT